MENKNQIPEYLLKNAQLGQFDKDGRYQFHKDQEALHSYFVDHVNQNTVFFHDLEEKLDYLVKNDYYRQDVLDLYSFDTIKSLYKYAYSFRYRFKSFIGALKFYQFYALRTNDNSRFLERYEDRVVANALLLGNGDSDLAKDIVEVLITSQYQPATPTFSNTLRTRSGEMVSCFLLRVEDNMESIGRSIQSALQLSRIGGGVALLLSNIREAGSPIKGVAGRARGPIPIMKLYEDAFSYADQLG